MTYKAPNRSAAFMISVIVAILVVSFSACRSRQIDKVSVQVPIGMPREDAVRMMNNEAWYHQPCPVKNGTIDLFFYGSHDYDKADIVIMRSGLQDGIYRVTELGTYAPQYWHGAFHYCIDRARFDK